MPRRKRPAPVAGPGSQLEARPPGAWRSGPRAEAAILLAALAVFFAPALAGGRFLYRDTGRMHVPVKQFIGEELRAGRFPSWIPWDGLGLPTLGAAVHAVLHPFTLLLALLPVHAAVTAWVILSLLAAGLGAASWARRLGAGPSAAILASLGYAFTGFLVSSTDNLQYLTALAAVPWIFATADRWLERGGPGPLAALGVASALCAAAGDPQSWGMAVLGAPIFALAVARRDGPMGRRLARAGAGVAVCVAAAAPVVLPLVLWLPETNRTAALDAATQARWNLAPIRLVELVVPGLLQDGGGVTFSWLHVRVADAGSSTPWVTSVYLGVTVAALAVAAAASDRRARLLLALSAFALWCAMGHHAGFGQLAARAPVLQSFRYWEKLAVWPALFLAVAAALGLERLRSDLPLARRLALGAAAVGAGALALIAAAPALAASVARRAGGERPEELAEALSQNLSDGFLHAGAVALALGAAAWLLSRGRRSAAPAVIVAVVALDLTGANVRAYHLHRADVDSPPSALAAWLAGRGRTERVLTPFEPIAEQRGFTQSEALNRLGALTLASAWNAAYRVGNFDHYAGPTPRRLADVNDPLAPTRLVPNVGLWDVGFVVVPGDPKAAPTQSVPASAPIVAADPAVPAWLFEIPHRPRVYVAREVVPVDRGGALSFALDPASAGGDRTVVEGAAPAGAARGATGTAELLRDDPTAIDVRARADGTALLVLNDLFAPGWTATVDGVERPILAANYLARGVWLPGGEHRVEFRYRTPGLAAGLAVALLGALAIGGWALLRRRRPAEVAGGPDLRGAA